MMVYRKRQTGYTLMEVLVVIVILVLVAGIVYTATAQVREKGRQAVCSSQLHQIGLALKLYQSDYNGRPPEGKNEYWQLGLPPPSNMWLAPYIKNRQVWFCPNDARQDRSASSYRWYWWEGVGPLGQFRDRPALCGARLPLLDCPWHGMEQGTDTFLLILRWDGTVKGQYIQVPMTPCLD